MATMMTSNNIIRASEGDSYEDISTNHISEWRSIVTLIVFVIANTIVIFPFHCTIFVPRVIANLCLDLLSAARVVSPRRKNLHQHGSKQSPFARYQFPLNFLTAPLIADLFLLAIEAIGREEVYAGTIGANHIKPYDIMIFFITLAYIAISIDASGLIRYLAFKVLQKGGKVGHRLFFYLYAFFFGLGSFIGNDPIILSGTAFLAYMTRVSSNIMHPRAWIHTQFAIANIASAILVSSNPTNLVLAGAFRIKFIEYTANMIVPVVVTAIVLFPFLLYIVFADEALIPLNIEMHELPAEILARQPVNPNIPNARGVAEEEEEAHISDEQGQLLSLEEIMNPFLDKKGAGFGAVVMTATLVTVLALNAAAQKNGEKPLYWVTLPATAVMVAWDLWQGWLNRHETRKIARDGRREIEEAHARRAEEAEKASKTEGGVAMEKQEHSGLSSGVQFLGSDNTPQVVVNSHVDESSHNPDLGSSDAEYKEKSDLTPELGTPSSRATPSPSVLDAEDKSRNHERDPSSTEMTRYASPNEIDEEAISSSHNQEFTSNKTKQPPATLCSLCSSSYRWSQETFPTVMAVTAHLPFALIPFAFAMFVLVQALVSRGWVPVFAYGWDHWVNKTGTIGAIGGMGFLSVILCNIAGTNIASTILLSRIIQAWQAIHDANGLPISDRTFWATVYSMALGVNYGAFSFAFNGALAGLLWRDILERKHIHVRRLEFARVNLPIIAIAMTVGCAVLVGEVYIIRSTKPYND